MKRLVILIVLVLVAGLAGIVRSKNLVHFGHYVRNESPAVKVRDEIRKSFELAPGARVEVSGINGGVTVETADTKTAEVLIERTADSQESLDRRKVKVEGDAKSLRISSERADSGFFAQFVGSNPREQVTLKLPRQISLETKGINGSLNVGELEGSVQVTGVNGRVEIAGARGTADFKGVNGNIQVGLRQLSADGVSLSGINGNIELQLEDGLNADLDAHGMNGRVISELPGVTVEKEKGGRYFAHIGSGGNAISVRGINGNIRLTRASAAAVNGIADNRADGNGPN
jgi:DUF4097 and DUF4098 domain-containing protein YvlB